jgi:hypothetical protein
MTTHIKDESQRAFEIAIMPRIGGAYFDKHECGEYNNHVVEAAWEGWQASEQRIKEKLLSEEMVTRAGAVIRTELDKWNLDAIDGRDTSYTRIEHELAKAVLQAVVGEL